MVNLNFASDLFKLINKDNQDEDEENISEMTYETFSMTCKTVFEVTDDERIDEVFFKIDLDSNDKISFTEFIYLFGKNLACPVNNDVKAYAESVSINTDFLISRGKMTNYSAPLYATFVEG